MQPGPSFSDPRCALPLGAAAHVERWRLPDGDDLYVTAGPGIEAPDALTLAVGRPLR